VSCAQQFPEWAGERGPGPLLGQGRDEPSSRTDWRGLQSKRISRCRALGGRGACSAQGAGVPGGDSGDNWELTADKCDRGWSQVGKAARLHVQRLRGGEKAVCLEGGRRLCGRTGSCTDSQTVRSLAWHTEVSRKTRQSLSLWRGTFTDWSK